MTDMEKWLRHCAANRDCIECPYNDKNSEMSCISALMMDAAKAIHILQEEKGGLKNGSDHSNHLPHLQKQGG